jgi:hypothetical protein
MSAPPDEPAAAPKWQFSLRTMLIALGFAALLCAPPAYWGWSGAALSVVLLGTAVAVTLHVYRRLTLVEVLVIIAVTGMTAACLAPAVQSGPRPRVSAWRNGCFDNMKQIVMAMHLYHDAHGHFPPAYVADEFGRPMHSWRVLLLPYLEEKKKYDAYRWDEPWNGPNNSKLAECPEIFHCPSDPAVKTSPMTSYVVVSGPGTAFPGAATTSFQDFRRDGTSKSILIVEVANSGIHWMEPRDLNLQQMAATINAQAGQGISSCHNGGAVCALADSSVHFLSETLSAQELRAMLTIDGGETVTLP